MRRTVFTVAFEEPFWVGTIERWDGSMLFVGRHVFGGEPSNAELTRFLLDDLARVPLHAAPGGRAPTAPTGNAKRREREAHRDLRRPPSVARDTYNRLLAEEGAQRSREARRERDEREERRLQRKTEKRKARHRGR